MGGKKSIGAYFSVGMQVQITLGPEFRAKALELKLCMDIKWTQLSGAFQEKTEEYSAGLLPK